jgi:hypothetical protein
VRRFVATLLTAGLLTAAGVLVAPPASACSCPPLTTVEYLRIADAVFTGTLVSREVASGRPVTSSGDPALHVFTVDRVYKGEVREVQGVVSAASGASCGLELQGEGPFLVFATRAGDLPAGRYSADLCGGTAPLTAGLQAEIDAVTGVSVEPPERRDPLPGEAGTGPGGPPLLTAVVAGGALAVALAGWFVLRRRQTAR